MKYDVAVIGGGPAGYTAAIRAAQLGGSVILFERDTLGGTCLNRGCIPTKTYLRTVEQLRQIEAVKRRGIVLDVSFSVDMPKVVSHKNGVVKRLTGGVNTLLRSYGVEVVRGDASLLSADSITCGKTTYQAASIILCGGSRPGRIPIPGIDSKCVLTSDDILELTELPKRLVIIGGGVIGCEMAAAFSGFGSQVTILEAMDRLLPGMDEELAAAMEKQLKADGITVDTGQRVECITDDGKGGGTVRCKDGSCVSADRILISVGRSPDLAALGVMASSIRQEKGAVVVDEHMRTNVRGIYAAGDINGRLMLAHAAFMMGETAAACAMGQETLCRLDAVPACVYTSPEAASVGLTEAQAISRYGADALLIGRFPFAANGRALASGEAEGFVKVLANARYGELLGVHIYGSHASEMIAECAALIHAEATVNEIAEIPHPHPSFSEAFMEACADALKRSVHLPRPGSK